MFYAYLFFLIGFYPVSDLYSGGTKTLILTGNRNRWIVSKLLWAVTMIIIYFGLFSICLLVNTIFMGNSNSGFRHVMDFYGVSSDINPTQFITELIAMPVMITIAMSFCQFVISITVNALAGYIAVITILVVSIYWMKAFLIGNYLMPIRYDLISYGGMKMINGIILGLVTIVFMVALGCLIFLKKDICKTSERC